MNIDAHNEATHSLATLLARGDEMHAPRFYELLARRLVANALLVRGYLEPVVEKSDRTVLKQQREAGLSEREKVEEDLYYARRDVDELEGVLARMGGHAPLLVDRDLREQDREDDRAREALQDERASQNAPRVGRAS